MVKRAMNRGKIYVVGTGPGKKKEMTLRALQALEEAEVVIGYRLYLELISELLEGKKVISLGMRRELERCQIALDEALQGKKVVLVSGGDAGIYGLAGALLQLLAKKDLALEVDVIPGVTAASAAAACLGAPLMHDFAAISLSDLLTPWETIEKRLHMAGKGDFVIVLYNPGSRGRREQLKRAGRILLSYRPPRTPVGIVRNAGRDGEQKKIIFLEAMHREEIDMSSTVIVGNSMSFLWREKMITPRGYEL